MKLVSMRRGRVAAGVLRVLGVGLAQEMGRLAGAVQGGFALVATGRVVRVTVNRVLFRGWAGLGRWVKQAALPG